jgi:hypothetical protein
VKSAAGLLGGHAHFLHWGVLQISLANLIVIALMMILFVLAVVLKLPHADSDDAVQEDTDVAR